MKPALTPEEWAKVLDSGWCGWMLKELSNHGAAAKLLHEQPFGFTREDVELLRETVPTDVDQLGYAYEIQSYLHDLADRIAALLPPEEEVPSL